MSRGAIYGARNKKGGRMKRGFTLIELVVVLIIVAILGTLGLTQYTRLVEKARGAEAKQILGSIRQLAAGYYMEWNSAAGLTNTMLGISGIGGVPGPLSGAGTTADCASSHYFWYSSAPTTTDITITANRCTAGGKLPVGLTGSIALTSTLSTGSDTWGPAGSPYL